MFAVPANIPVVMEPVIDLNIDPASSGFPPGFVPDTIPNQAASAPLPAFSTLLQRLLANSPVSTAPLVPAQIETLDQHANGPPPLDVENSSDGRVSPEHSGNGLPLQAQLLDRSSLVALSPAQTGGEAAHMGESESTPDPGQANSIQANAQDALRTLLQLRNARSAPLHAPPSPAGLMRLGQPHTGPVVAAPVVASVPGTLSPSSLQGNALLAEGGMPKANPFALLQRAGDAANPRNSQASLAGNPAVRQPGLLHLVRGPRPVDSKEPAAITAGPLHAARQQPQDMVAAGNRVPLAAAPDPLPEAMERQIKLLSTRNGGSAQIRLNPPELGHLRINVIHVDGHTRVSVVAHSDAASQLLHEHVPQLRALLGDGATVTVHQHGGANWLGGSGRHNGDGRAQTPNRLDNGVAGGDDKRIDGQFTDASIEAVGLHGANGLVDLYA